MNENLSRLEFLPNEIFIEIFKNLDARYIFRAFYNLNTRFNTLLQSVDHCRTISTPNSNESIEDKVSFPYIHTLIIKNGVDIMFDHLINVSRVILHYYPKYTNKNLEINIASNVEYISVLSPNLWLLIFSTDFTRKIFSNGFPYLKSCCLPRKAVILSNEKWTQSPSLRIFKIGYIRSNIYKAILSSCPNLYSLKFTKWPRDRSTFLVKSPHMNLKRLVINLHGNDLLNDHLLCVPKLEQLIIYLILRDSQSLISIMDSDWFASVIDGYLPMLCRFDCYLIFTPSTNMNEIDKENILDQIREKFKQMHNERYQSKIVFKFQK